MKKKLKFLVALFFVMCCFMGLPVICEADYEDGAECPGCGHYHWDEYMCGNCGYCSDECTNEACYSENHCNGCGACISDLDWYCPDCWCCEDCISKEDLANIVIKKQMFVVLVDVAMIVLKNLVCIAKNVVDVVLKTELVILTGLYHTVQFVV